MRLLEKRTEIENEIMKMYTGSEQKRNKSEGKLIIHENKNIYFELARRSWAERLATSILLHRSNCKFCRFFAIFSRTFADFHGFFEKLILKFSYEI